MDREPSDSRVDAPKAGHVLRDHDRKVTFDEHGNYVPPDENDKTNGGSKSGWVN